MDGSAGMTERDRAHAEGRAARGGRRWSVSAEPMTAPVVHICRTCAGIARVVWVFVRLPDRQTCIGGPCPACRRIEAQAWLAQEHALEYATADRVRVSEPSGANAHYPEHVVDAAAPFAACARCDEAEREHRKALDDLRKATRAAMRERFEVVERVLRELAPGCSPKGPRDPLVADLVRDLERLAAQGAELRRNEARTDPLCVIRDGVTRA